MSIVKMADGDVDIKELTIGTVVFIGDSIYPRHLVGFSNRAGFFKLDLKFNGEVLYYHPEEVYLNNSENLVYE